MSSFTDSKDREEGCAIVIVDENWLAGDSAGVDMEEAVGQ